MRCVGLSESTKTTWLNGHCDDIDRDPREIAVTHLTTAMAGSDPNDLRDRIKKVRGRTTSVEEFSRCNNAGLATDLVNLFAEDADAGAQHSIVALPDVHLDGSIEVLGEVISAFDRS